MRYWQVQDAQTRFGEMLDASLKEGPQIVSRQGQAQAVLVSLEQWERRASQAAPEEGGKNMTSLKDVLLAREPRFELEPSHGNLNRRKPVAFEE